MLNLYDKLVMDAANTGGKSETTRNLKHLGVLKMKAKINAKEIAENRVQRKYPNLKVLNSYLVYLVQSEEEFE